MRIAGGALRGRRLKVPPAVRPTGGRVREALFDVWAPRLAGSRFLDLFAGSGAVGLEALGRGAAFCLAIEHSGPAFAVLSRNYETLLPDGPWQLSRARLPAGLRREDVSRGGPFDLVFADPPYEFVDWEPLLAGIASVLAAGGEAVVEHGRRNRPPARAAALERHARRAYGETELSFYSPAAKEPSPDSRPR